MIYSQVSTVVAKILLASGSTARQKMLTAAGVKFTAETAILDEKISRLTMVADDLPPAQIALNLATAKARKVSARNPDAVVIGGDQILVCGGEILGKVTTRFEARARLAMFRHHPHHLISSVVVVKNQEVQWHATDKATIRFRHFSDAYLDQYLEQMGADISHSVACYELEGRGSRLFSHVKGDYFTVLGMPLLPLLNYLSETGKIDG